MFKNNFLLLFIVLFLFQFSSFGQRVGINVYKEYTLLPSRYGAEINYQFNDKIKIAYSYQYFNKDYINYEFDEYIDYTQDIYVTPSIHIHEISFVSGRKIGHQTAFIGIGIKPALHFSIGKMEIRTGNRPFNDWIYSTKDIINLRPSVSGLFQFGYNDIFDSNFSIIGEIQGGIILLGDYPVHDYVSLQVLFTPFARIGLNLSYKLPFTNHSDDIE